MRQVAVQFILFPLIFLIFFSLLVAVPAAQAQTACVLKNKGDADCNNAVELADFEVWRKEYMAVCKQSTISVCAPDVDNNGNLMDADFNGIPEQTLNNELGVALPDFEIWRSQFTKLPTVTPTPPGTAFQPTAPYYATFFYQWYTSPTIDSSWGYWADHSNTPSNTWFSYYLPDPQPSVFNPAQELYSSNDYSIFKWQVAKMAEAKIEVSIASWFGPNTREDKVLNNVINSFMSRADNPYPNLRWAVYYEDEGFADPSVDLIAADLQYIKDKYASSPYVLKVNNKPAIFVYAGANDVPGTMTSRWKQANARLNNYFYINLKVFPNFPTDTSQPDGWHQYAPAARQGTTAPHYYFVSPGFYLDDRVSPERLPRNPAEFEQAVQSMVAANVTWKLIETWNEWGEGTSVEPGDHVRLNTTTGKEEINPSGNQFKNLYIDILKRNLPALEGGIPPSVTPTSITPTNSQSVTITAAGDMVADLTRSPSSKHREVSDLILQINPQYVLALGDVQYEFGLYSTFIQYYDPSYGRFKQKTLPAVGNHEYLDSVGSIQTTPDCDVLQTGNVFSYACGYFDYFNGKGNLSGLAGERGKGYYAKDVGAWRVYAINSNCGLSTGGRPGCTTTSSQYQWLKADMQANPRQCSLIMMHHPYITSDERDHIVIPPSSYDLASVEPLLQVFYNNGGDLYLAGHTHLYERFAPYRPGTNKLVEVYPFNGTRSKNISDPAADNTYGIRQIIVGTGGKNVYAPNNMTPLDQFPDPDGNKLETLSEAHSNDTNTFGVLKLDLNSTSYRWEYMPIASSTQFKDSGTGTCHGIPPNPVQ